MRTWSSVSTLVIAGIAVGALVPSVAGLPERSAAAPRAAETITLTPEADAYVDQALPATNFNTAAAWPVEKDTMARERYPLLRFDLSAIPEESEVVGASLELWLESGSGEPIVDIEVQRITLTWDQATVTWNNRPPTQGRWASWDTDDEPGWRMWDVRALVNNWVRGAMPNHGVVLRSGDEVVFERLFESTGARKPRLVVEFEPPTPTPTPTPTETPSSTPTPSATPTPSPTPTVTPTSTWTAAPSATSTPTPTTTPAVMATATASQTPTLAPSPTGGPTAAPSPTPTEATPSPTSTEATPSPTSTATPTASATPTGGSPGPGPTWSPTATTSATPTADTPGPTPSPTSTATPTASSPPPIVGRIFLAIARKD